MILLLINVSNLPRVAQERKFVVDLKLNTDLLIPSTVL